MAQFMSTENKQQGKRKRNPLIKKSGVFKEEGKTRALLLPVSGNKGGEKRNKKKGNIL